VEVDDEKKEESNEGEDEEVPRAKSSRARRI
jgi:hypothetical protein